MMIRGNKEHAYTFSYKKEIIIMIKIKISQDETKMKYTKANKVHLQLQT